MNPLFIVRVHNRTEGSGYRHETLIIRASNEQDANFIAQQHVDSLTQGGEFWEIWDRALCVTTREPEKNKILLVL